MKSKDYVELVENPVIKDGLYQIEMVSHDKIMLNISIDKDNHMNTLVHKKYIQNHITKEAYDEMQEGSKVAEVRFCKSLFSELNF